MKKFSTSLLLIIGVGYAEESKKVGMPQMDFSTYPTQIFWTIIIFAVMILISIFFLLPRSKKIKDNRDLVVDKALKIVHKSKLEVEVVKNRIKQARAASDSEITEISNKISEDNKKLLLKINQKVNEESTEKRLELSQQIREIEANFHNNLEDNLVVYIKDIGKKLLGVDISEDLIRRKFSEK